MLHEWIEAIYKKDVTGLTKKSSFVYKELLTKLQEDGAVSQVYSLLKTCQGFHDLPSFFKKELQDRFEKTLASNLWIKKQTDQLLNLLEKEELEVIPLKGVYFAEQVYGHFSARATSDIDLLIHQKDYEKVRACVVGQGFFYQEDVIPGHFHTSFSQPFLEDVSLTVELHWTVIKEDSSALKVDSFWQHALPFKATSSSYIKRLNPQDLFYMMVLHAWRHNLDGLRHYLDVIQLIYALGDTLDYEALLERAEQELTLKRVVRTLSKIYQEFPFLNAVKPFPYQMEKWYWGGDKKSSLKTYVDFMDYQFRSHDKVHHNVKEAVNWFVNEKLRKS